MFKLLVIVFIGIAAVQAGRLRREGPPPTTSEALLEGGANIAQDGIKKLEEIANDLLSAQSTDKLKEKGGALWEQIQSLANTIKETTQTWSENTSVKEIKEISEHAVKEFAGDHPDLTAAVTKGVQDVNQAANDIILKLKLLVDDKDFKEISNTLIENTSASVNVLKEQVKEATSALKAKLTHDAQGNPIQGQS